MRVDIIHVRDPDAACDHEVYIEGERVDAEFWSFDPGAGYSTEDFEEQRQWAIDAAPDFLKARIAQIYDDMKRTYERWSC